MSFLLLVASVFMQGSAEPPAEVTSVHVVRADIIILSEVNEMVMRSDGTDLYSNKIKREYILLNKDGDKYTVVRRIDDRKASTKVQRRGGEWWLHALSENGAWEIFIGKTYQRRITYQNKRLEPPRI